VIGAEGRARFIHIAQKCVQRLLHKKPSSPITAAKKPREGHASLWSNDEDTTDLREDIATRARKKLKARQTTNSMAKYKSDE
jgi:hypothetical protein